MMASSSTKDENSSSRATVLLIILCITYACVVQYSIVLDMVEHPNIQFQPLPKHAAALFQTAKEKARLIEILMNDDDDVR